MRVQDLPYPSLQAKAEILVGAILSGEPFHSFGGRRLPFDRQLVSVRLGRRYRAIFREFGKVRELVEVLSHEDYNNFMGRARR